MTGLRLLGEDLLEVIAGGPSKAKLGMHRADESGALMKVAKMK